MPHPYNDIDHGIIIIDLINVLYLKGFGLDRCVRITIGTDAETEVLIKKIDKYYFNVI